MGNTHRYLQVMPVAPPAPVAPAFDLRTMSPLQEQYGLFDGLFLQNQDFVNPMDGHTYHTALQNQYGLLDGLFLQNQDFVNPHDGITYHTALQNQYGLLDGLFLQNQNIFEDGFNAAKKEATKQFNNFHIDQDVKVGDMTLHVKK